MQRRLQAGWVGLLSLLAVLSLVGANKESGAPIDSTCLANQTGSDSGLTVDYTTSGAYNTSTFSFLVGSSKQPLKSWAIRLNNGFANQSPTLLTSPRPNGTLNTEYIASYGPAYTFPANGTGTKVYSFTVVTPTEAAKSLMLTDICQQNVVVVDDAGNVVFRQPSNAQDQAPGSCFIFFQLADGSCSYQLLTDKEGYEPTPFDYGNPPVASASLGPSPVAAISPSPAPSLSAPSPAPTASPVPAPSPIIIPSPKASPSPAAIPSPSPTAISSPSPVATPSPKASPSPTATASPSPKATPSPSPAATASPSPKVTSSPSPTATALPSPTATPSPKTPSPTATASPSTLFGSPIALQSPSTAPASPRLSPVPTAYGYYSPSPVYASPSLVTTYSPVALPSPGRSPAPFYYSPVVASPAPASPPPTLLSPLNVGKASPPPSPNAPAPLPPAPYRPLTTTIFASPAVPPSPSPSPSPVSLFGLSPPKAPVPAPASPSPAPYYSPSIVVGLSPVKSPSPQPSPAPYYSPSIVSLSPGLFGSPRASPPAYASPSPYAPPAYTRPSPVASPSPIPESPENVARRGLWELLLPSCIMETDQAELQCLDEGVCGSCFAKKIDEATPFKVSMAREFDFSADRTTYTFTLTTSDGSAVPDAFSVRMADDIVASNLFPADIYPEPVVGADHSPYFRACDSNGLQNTLKWTDFTFSKAKTATFTFEYDGLVNAVASDVYIMSGEGNTVLRTAAEDAAVATVSWNGSCAWQALQP